MKTRVQLIVLCLSLTGVTPGVLAQEPLLGEIRWVPYNFAPRGWAFCDGQLLPISAHNALFSLLGTTYGGDGRTTFALPDLRGRVPINAGRGPGLSEYRLGQKGGQEQVALTESQIPAHNHSLNASDSVADSQAPGNKRLAAKERTKLYSGDTGATVPMENAGIGTTGGSQAHENRPPYITLHCIIALQGIFPSRS